jgi:hypothetical protein
MSFWTTIMAVALFGVWLVIHDADLSDPARLVPLRY